MDWLKLIYSVNGQSVELLFTEENTPDFSSFAPRITGLMKQIKTTEDRTEKGKLMEQLWIEINSTSILLEAAA